MKKLYLLIIICLVMMIGAEDVFSQDLVNVTFRANAAAWRDTLGADGLVQIRGQVANVAPPTELSDGVTIDWSGNTTMYLTNVEGDYWEGTFAIPKGTVLVYKFFANARHSTVTPDDEWHHDGWEFNVSDGVDGDGVSAGTNRKLDLADVEADTVLPVQFINGIGHGDMAQYQTLWEDVDGTFAVWIRVNVAGWEDWNPENHVIAVRGSNREDWGQTGQLSWGESHPLNQEGTSRFYSNVVNVPDAYAAANLRFKFVVHFAGRPLDEDWGDLAYNTNVDIDVETSGADTTIYWKWFDNLKPIAADHDDELIVTFRADMTQAISERGFSHGDTLEVRSGFAGTAEMVSTKRMVRVGFTNVYTATDTVTGSLNADLAYQYYMWKDGNDLREIYYDFTYPDKGDPTAERRRVMVTSSTSMVEDNSTDVADPRRRPRFRNTSLLSKAVAVTYVVDVRPAIFQVMAGAVLNDIQGNLDVMHPDSVLAWGVAINGPATGGWGGWGPGLMADETRRMEDQGDSTFTLTINYTTSDFIGQEFKFGIGGGDNEGGFGNNHIENIDDTEDTFMLLSQFGSIDPLFYNAWDFENRVPIIVGPPVVVLPESNWNFVDVFPDAETTVWQHSAHGAAVDDEGKVWVSPYYSRLFVPTEGDTIRRNPVYVFNADGTPADFSPVYEGEINGEIVRFGPVTGLNRDHEGNILVATHGTRPLADGSTWDASTAHIVRVNAETGEFMGMGDVTYMRTETAAQAPNRPAVTEDGYIGVSFVFPGSPIIILDPDFELVQAVTDDGKGGFSRTFEISADGRYLYNPSTTLFTTVYYSEFGVLGEYEIVDTTLGLWLDPGAVSRDPVDDNILWMTATGSGNNPLPEDNPYYNHSSKVFAFDLTTGEIVDYAESPGDFRIPRALAFSPDGEIMYVGTFSMNVPLLHKFTKEPVSVRPSDRTIAENFSLSQNYPNPFNPTTTIQFSLPTQTSVRLDIYNMLGQRVKTLVADEMLQAGNYDVVWNGTNDQNITVPSGMYIYRITAGNFVDSKRMMFLK
jgi:hypothetical protein